MATTMKSRFPLFLLLGVLLLASVCVSYGISQSEREQPPTHCKIQCDEEEDEPQHRPGQWRPSHDKKDEDDEDDPRPHRPGQWRPSHEKKDEDDEYEPRPHRPGQWRPSHDKKDEEDEDEPRPHHPGQWRPSHGKKDEEDEDEPRPHQPHRPGQWRPSHEKKDKEHEYEPRPHRPGQWRPSHEKKDEEDEYEPRPHRPGQWRPSHGQKEDGEDERPQRPGQGRRNPFFFRSNKFQTLFLNKHGHIRLLQRFERRSNLLQNLKNYRLVEYRSKPQTLILPLHNDADFILVVLNGKAILTVLNPNNRNSFNLERGDTIKLPAGTIAYLANRDNDEDLRVVNLAIPVNRPGKFQSFFPYTSQKQQSYFNAFSKNILEASFNTNYETIERVLLEEKDPQLTRERRRPRDQERGAIVKVSREQIEELSRHAKSSLRKISSSESQPLSLRSRNPIYSNKFGRFFEITPQNSPQLQDLDISISSTEINEGALFLPHYNSRAIVVLMVNEGRGNLELVGLRNEQQEQREEDDEDEQQEDEEERSRQVQRYRARLSRGDVVVIPAGYPVAVNASSNLNLIGFGINAENNQRNFLAGEEDNVISLIQNPVKDLAFPGSAQEINRLIQKQKQSYFANGQPQQREGRETRGPLSSILSTFY